jgi:S-formylglutathione hydrolase
MVKQIESIKEFSGFLNRYEHDSECCHCKMTFSVYLPPQATEKKVPVLYWLSGLTCSDDNARTKAGMQRYAVEEGIAIVFPDTSPRGDEVPDVADRYDLGKAAGFYVNATVQPWVKHYQMYTYVTEELPALINQNFPVIPDQISISGHSMGGHGALICALTNPDRYQSVSAFSPICNPMNCDWGIGAFGLYLGDKQADWQVYDATNLVIDGARSGNTILIDQGTSDEFYEQGQLLTENFKQACEQADQLLDLRYQSGYDHSYHFVSTFIGEHIRFHAKALK